VGWLESELCLVGRIGSGVQVSASFQIFALRMFLHSAGVTSGGFFLGVIYEGMSKGIAGDNPWGIPENPRNYSRFLTNKSLYRKRYKTAPLLL